MYYSKYADLVVFVSQSQGGSSLGGSLGSTTTATATGGTAGGNSLKQSTTDPLANSHLRNVDIGNIGISNEFEEEDEMEESKSESVHILAYLIPLFLRETVAHICNVSIFCVIQDLGGGLNKMGMNLLGVEDLGLKVHVS